MSDEPLDASRPAAAHEPAASDAAAVERNLRWRMILGRHAEGALALPDAERRRDAVLGELYDRVFAERAPHRATAGGGDGFEVPQWLGAARQLFPIEAARVLESDALHRFGWHELLTDPEVIEAAEPTEGLVRAILLFKDRMTPPVLHTARRLVREVIAQVRRRFEVACAPALYGPRGDGRAVRSYRNVDWTRTIRGNLARWDAGRKQLLVDRFSFRRRQQRRSPWHVIIAVDQSGSMVDSLVHAAILAAVFAAAPSVTVHLLLWDHRVVDVSEVAADPLAVLMGAQLGGGTRMLPALHACAERVVEPKRTLVVVISDFFVTEPLPPLLAVAAELVEAGARCVGVCSLDDVGRGTYDASVARAFAEVGWRVGATTPKQLAELLDLGG